MNLGNVTVTKVAPAPVVTLVGATVAAAVRFRRDCFVFETAINGLVAANTIPFSPSSVLFVFRLGESQSYRHWIYNWRKFPEYRDTRALADAVALSAAGFADSEGDDRRKKHSFDRRKNGRGSFVLDTTSTRVHKS